LNEIGEKRSCAGATRTPSASERPCRFLRRHPTPRGYPLDHHRHRDRQRAHRRDHHARHAAVARTFPAPSRQLPAWRTSPTAPWSPGHSGRGQPGRSAGWSRYVRM